MCCQRCIKVVSFMVFYRSGIPEIFVWKQCCKKLFVRDADRNLNHTRKWPSEEHRIFFNQNISHTTNQHSKAAGLLLNSVTLKLQKGMQLHTPLLSPVVFFLYSVCTSTCHLLCCGVQACWSVCASGIASIPSLACQSFDFPQVRLVIETGA